MPPVWPWAVAVAPQKEARPKFASCSVWQPLEAGHTEGASMIHSAEEVSTRVALRELEKCAPVERSRMRSVTRRPCTVADAETVSPGLARSGTVTGGAGSTSNHVEYTARPPCVQSA